MAARPKSAPMFAALAFSAAIALAPAPAHAETCLLDVTGEGTVQANDGDLGASSSINDHNAGSSDDDNLACGNDATARGDGSTALGNGAQAGYIDQTLNRVTGFATAVGDNAIAHGQFGIAVEIGRAHV